MNRAKLAMLAGTSLCLGCGLSQAADLPVKARIAPVPVVDPWVGWYAGGNVGYSWGRSDTTAVVGPALEKDATTYFAPGGTSTIGSKVNGVIAGVQLGYIGRIAPSWLGGVEADFQWRSFCRIRIFDNCRSCWFFR